MNLQFQGDGRDSAPAPLEW